MARLTNRPSLAYSDHSRLPSATPDPQYDQENIDPRQLSARNKGKQRVPMSHPPEPVDGPDPNRRSSKRRRITPEPQDDDSAAQADANFNKYFDPNQNAEERREVNRQQRELNREIVESREELLKDSGDKLAETVQKANKVFENVKQTGDACVDSRFLVDVGSLAYKKSAALVSGDGSTGIDLDDFVGRLISYMRTGNPSTRPPATQRQAEDDLEEDEDLTPLDWVRLGRDACFPYNTRPPVPSFLLGPLSLEKKQRTQVQRRARQARNNAAEARPEAIDKDALEEAEQSSLTAQCATLRKNLRAHIKTASRAVHDAGITSEEEASTQKAKQLFEEHRLRLAEGNQAGVPLFQYVINPHSFGQTIENLFYVSFLIKEGSVGIGVDDEELPVLFITTPRSLEDQREQGVSKHQAVLSLDYTTWRQLIKAYNITEPMIPHRSDTQPLEPGAGTWYR